MVDVMFPSSHYYHHHHHHHNHHPPPHHEPHQNHQHHQHPQQQQQQHHHHHQQQPPHLPPEQDLHYQLSGGVPPPNVQIHPGPGSSREALLTHGGDQQAHLQPTPPPPLLLPPPTVVPAAPSSPQPPPNVSINSAAAASGGGNKYRNKFHRLRERDRDLIRSRQDPYYFHYYQQKAAASSASAAPPSSSTSPAVIINPDDIMRGGEEVGGNHSRPDPHLEGAIPSSNVAAGRECGHSSRVSASAAHRQPLQTSHCHLQQPRDQKNLQLLTNGSDRDAIDGTTTAADVEKQNAKPGMFPVVATTKTNNQNCIAKSKKVGYSSVEESGTY